MNTKDVAFAYKVRHALDRNVAELPDSTSDRLANARKAALARKKPDTVQVKVTEQKLATASMSSSYSSPVFTWLGRVGFVIPLVALVFGLMGIHEYEQRQQILEAASIDAEVLTDELPLSAYLDHGFDAYLAKESD